MKQTTYNVKFTARVTLGGEFQISATSEAEAEKLAKLILKQNLNSEDCLIEIGKKENITIMEMELLPNITALDIEDTIPLD